MTDSIWFTDALMRIHVAPETTGGAYALIEAIVPAGHMPPPHVHEREDEGFFVLEGEVTLHDERGATVLRPGQGANLPAGAPHTFCVTSSGPARLLLVSAPGGFADYVRAAGRPAERDALPVLDGPPDIGALLAEAPAHGITFVGPPGSVPAVLAAAGA